MGLSSEFGLYQKLRREAGAWLTLDCTARFCQLPLDCRGPPEVPRVWLHSAQYWCSTRDTTHLPQNGYVLVVHLLNKHGEAAPEDDEKDLSLLVDVQLLALPFTEPRPGQVNEICKLAHAGKAKDKVLQLLQQPLDPRPLLHTIFEFCCLYRSLNRNKKMGSKNS